MMWGTFKNAITTVKDALGIEIPGLPVDLGAIDAGGIGEVATTAATGLTEGGASGVAEAAGAVGAAATATVDSVSDAGSGMSQAR
jgi:hypothetical protein